MNGNRLNYRSPLARVMFASLVECFFILLCTSLYVTFPFGNTAQALSDWMEMASKQQLSSLATGSQ